MPKHTLLSEPDHVDEPQQIQDYRGLVSRVAATQHPVIVRRGGADVAAVIPVAHLELLRELLAQQEAEQRAAQVDWAQMAQVSPPPQQWFEGDEPKPF
jgi:prevent-host-death family protein